jgi:predicted ATP-grasp superfamily ATP-dependent carboligase
MTVVMVIGICGTAGSNVARCLMRAGHHVVGVDPDETMLPLAICDEAYPMETLPADGWEHQYELNEFIAARRVKAIIAQPEEEVMFLAEHRSHINAATALPAVSEVVVTCADKLKTAQLLGGLAPWSGTRQEALDRMRYPLWARAKRGAGSTAAALCFNVDQFADWTAFWDSKGYEMMAADALPGDDYSFTGLWWNGHLVGQGAIHKLKMMGSHRRHSSTAMAQQTTDRIAAFRTGRRAVEIIHHGCPPHGPFKVDMREDEHGELKVCEINAGRFGLTVNHYMAAGLNLPDLAVRLMVAVKPRLMRQVAIPNVRHLRGTDFTPLSYTWHD